MIFVALGTQKFKMNRLLKEIDRLIEEEKIKDYVFAQVGNSDYIPHNYEYKRFLDKEDFERKIDDCNILISHGGVSTIISGITRNKPVIVVPRLSKYGEHVDNHQMEIAMSFEKLNYILACYDINQLSTLIKESRHHNFDIYISERDKMIDTIESYLDTIK